MKSIKNRKMKGSVLLTVVSVMALLIIFLFGTLVLATAANNRAHVNYSTAQTNITARTVVNTAYNAIAKNKDYADAITALSSTNTTLDIPVTISSSGTNVNTLGHLDSLTAEYAGTRKFYNANQKKWQDCDLVKITAEATMNGITTTSNAYIVKDPPSPPPSGGGGGAGFVTTGGASFSCQQTVFGGSYINLPTQVEAEAIDYLTGYGTYSGGYKAGSGYTGSYYSGSEYTFANSDKSVIEADSVFNGDIRTGHLSRLFFPGKGTGITVWGNFIYDKDGDAIQSFDQLFDISSTMTVASAGDIKFNQMPFMYVDKTISGPANLGPHLNGSNYDDTPGAQSYEFPFNTFAGNINVNTAFALGGDLYLMNADQPNVIDLDQRDGKLYSWTMSFIKKTGDTAVSKAQGSIYSKGNFSVTGQKDMQLQDLYCEKNVEFTNTGNVKFKGDLIVRGTITGSGTVTVEGDVYAASVSGVTLKDASGAEITGVTAYPAASKIYPEYAERDVILGLTQIGSIPINETQVVKRMDQVLNSVINPYENDSMPAPLTQKLNDLESDPSKYHFSSRDDAITKSAESRYMWCTSLWDSTAKKVKLDYTATGDQNSGAPVIRNSCVLTGSMDSSKDLSTPNYTGKPVIFDPGNGDMLVVLDGYTGSNDFIINDMEGGTVYFYIKAGTTYNYGHNIMTTKYLNLFGKMAYDDCDLDTVKAGAQKSFQIFTNSNYAMSYTAATDPVPYNSDALSLSIPSSAGKYSPGCKIYGQAATGGKANAKMSSPDGVGMLCAQIVSPNIEFTGSGTNGGPIANMKANCSIYYNGRKIKPNGAINIFGCLNANTADLNNITNVYYIPDVSGGPGPIILPDSTHWFEMLYYDEY